MKDSIKLAELLSNNQRLLPEEKSYFSSNEKFIYNEMIKNYYLYHNKGTYIFVYPKNVQNEILAIYLTKKILELTKELKITLTCSEKIDKVTINSMFHYGLEILNYDILNHYSEISEKINFLPLSVKDENKFIIDIKKVENYFYENFSRFGTSLKNDEFFNNINSNFEKLSAKEQMEYLLIGPFLEDKKRNLTYKMNILIKNPQRILETNYLSKNSDLIKINNFLKFVDINDNLKSLAKKSSLLKFNLDFSSMNISSLKGILIYLDWINKFYKKIMANKPKDHEIIEKFMKKFCNNNKFENLGIVCFIRYMNNDIYTEALKWISKSIFTVNYSQIEEEWFEKLVAMYNSKISNQDLYEEILNINEKQEIMKQVFFTVNNLLNPQFIHLCSPLKNETYKLNIKGEFLIFSQILYKNYCPGKVIFLELLALDKIIIDEDLVSHDIKQIIIIAPIWEIVQQRIINLDGASEYQNLVSEKYFNVHEFFIKII